MEPAKKVVLAYSGGVDTTGCILYLKHEWGVKEVIALLVDLGQDEDLEALKEKALLAGASQCIVKDAKELFMNQYCIPAIRANALYEDRYPLSSALARPLIARLVVEAAEELGADAVAHGSSGKGNDQVRFDSTYTLLNPHLKILAPAREWSMSRQETVAYSTRYGVPAHVDESCPYAFDLNMIGSNIEAGPLDDPWSEPEEEIYQMTRHLKEAPDDPNYVEITFERGIPVSLNGASMPAVDLLLELNRIAGEHCIGRVDMMENRVVGIKGREIYEAPGYFTLIEAHRDLETLTLPAEVTQFKRGIEQTYSNLIYNGLFYSPLKECLQAFIDKTQERVTGVVRVKLFKGMLMVVGRKSRYSLHVDEMALYGKNSGYDKEAAKGFIYVWTLPNKIWRQMAE